MFKTIASKAPTAIKAATLSDVSDSTVVIDFSLYVHRFNATQGHSFTGLFHQINILRENNICPIYVFDGKYPELKTKTMQSRKIALQKKKQSLEKLKKQKDASKEALFKAKNLTFRISDDELEFCKTLFDLLGVSWVQAKGEADILMANMVSTGKADAAMTEDADLLAFGCPVVWRKFKKGTVEVIRLDEVLRGFDMDLDTFRQFCILSGCDYIDTIRGIGPKTALKLLSEHQTIAGILKSKGKEEDEYPWRPVHKIFCSTETTRRSKFDLKKPKVGKLISFLKSNTELSQTRLGNIEIKLSQLI